MSNNKSLIFVSSWSVEVKRGDDLRSVDVVFRYRSEHPRIYTLYPEEPGVSLEDMMKYLGYDIQDIDPAEMAGIRTSFEFQTKELEKVALVLGEEAEMAISLMDFANTIFKIIGGGTHG